MSGVFLFLGYARPRWALARHRKDTMKDQDHQHYTEGKGWEFCPLPSIDCPISLPKDLDDCPPHGIARPSLQNDLVVNGETVVTCYDCDELFTTSNADLDDADYQWRCYGCLSLDTGDGWGASPK